MGARAAARAIAWEVGDMSATSEPDPARPLPPEWALGQAMNDRDDDDTVGRDERAWDLVESYETERHDEDDDPDEGGEG